jgi:hypothetical protein
VCRGADLRHPPNQYKVDVNAQDMSVVIVEGGTKSNKRYQKLMQHRINWNESLQDKGDDNDMGEERARVNNCSLMWQASVAKPRLRVNLYDPSCFFPSLAWRIGPPLITKLKSNCYASQPTSPSDELLAFL